MIKKTVKTYSWAEKGCYIKYKAKLIIKFIILLKYNVELLDFLLCICVSGVCMCVCVEREREGETECYIGVSVCVCVLWGA